VLKYKTTEATSTNSCCHTVKSIQIHWTIRKLFLTQLAK